MRIIAGEFRGRHLLAPESDATRPITDRVKQSLFDILAPEVPGSIVFDCFAGTGSMGLECLSRGAQCAIFFESDRSALTRLRRNIQTLKLDLRAGVIPVDIFRHWSAHPDQLPANLVFFDPPYRFLTERPEKLRQLVEQIADRMLPDGIVVFRHNAADHLQLPALRKYDERTYGGMMLEFLRSR